MSLLLDEKLYALLRDNKVALVLIDHPWMPQMNTITADFAYIRWVGDRKKVKGTLDDSIEVFGYFSKSYSGYPPGDVRMLLDQVNPP